jgi:hypothetical protein
MDAAEELKLTYIFEWDKKCHSLRVEIDTPEESTSGN